MTIVTTEYISEKKLETIGIVRGATIQTKHLGRDIAASLKTLIGGELRGYADLMNKAREVAVEMMAAEAAKLGADAIVSVRFASTSIMQGAAEVSVYGTAVKFVE